jgi:glycosyltransferase involved in cell wall biosynthesis
MTSTPLSPSEPSENGPQLRFGLDCAATHFPYPPGVARVAAELIPRLAASTEGPTCIPLEPPAGTSERKWRHVLLPRLERKLGLTGILSFTSAFPIAGRGIRMQTIHELPWLNDVSENSGRVHKLWARHGRRRATRIIVPSRHVLADLARFAPAAAQRASVVPWGVGAPFLNHVSPSKSDDWRSLASIDLTPGRFLLAVGATRSKKQPEVSIRGLAALSHTDVRLFITGKTGPEVASYQRLAHSLGVQDRVHFAGQVPELVLAALYRQASATLVLAKSEGFGFPALEAMAAGSPVLHPPGTSQAELCADLGIPVDPNSPESLLRGMTETLAKSKEEELGRREERVLRASQFTWSRCVETLQKSIRTSCS